MTRASDRDRDFSSLVQRLGEDATASYLHVALTELSSLRAEIAQLRADLGDATCDALEARAAQLGRALRAAFNAVEAAQASTAEQQGQPNADAESMLRLRLSEPRVASSVPPADPNARTRGRILVIDDEPLMRAALRRLLQAEHDVSVAASGREALAILESDPDFDLVLCDLMMPGMSGIEVHDVLVAQLPDYARRMCFLTGGAVTIRARDFLVRMAGRTLNKPFDALQVRDFVRVRLEATNKARDQR